VTYNLIGDSLEFVGITLLGVWLATVFTVCLMQAYVALLADCMMPPCPTPVSVLMLDAFLSVFLEWHLPFFTEKGRLELVFPTQLEKEIEEHKLRGKDEQFLAITNNRNEQSPGKEMICSMEEWGTGKYQEINSATRGGKRIMKI
jgi:hypothetical protein